jgi:hypothetical protein
MWVLGLLAIIYGASTFIFDYTDSIKGIVVVAVGVLIFTEIGIKKYTSLSRLKTLKSTEWVSLFVGAIVLITGIGLLFSYEIPILSQIANGSLLTGGIVVLLQSRF